MRSGDRFAATRFRPSDRARSGLAGSRFNRAQKPYKPHDQAKHAQLVALAQSGKRLAEIAAIYGGTKHGVRANLRRLRERGVIA